MLKELTVLLITEENPDKCNLTEPRICINIYHLKFNAQGKHCLPARSGYPSWALIARHWSLSLHKTSGFEIDLHCLKAPSAKFTFLLLLQASETLSQNRGGC